VSGAFVEGTLLALVGPCPVVDGIPETFKRKDLQSNKNSFDSFSLLPLASFLKTLRLIGQVSKGSSGILCRSISMFLSATQKRYWP